MTVRESNPFRRLRIKNDLSQYELARRAGVSKHAVLRLEQGMYDKPLPTVVSYFISHYDISPGQLQDEYQTFQIATRESNARLLGDIVDLLGSKPANAHPLVYLRSVQSPQLNPTELAKKLCISQTVVANLENKPVNQHTIPEQLIIALQDADYSEEETDALKEAYEKYRAKAVTAQRLRVRYTTPISEISA